METLRGAVEEVVRVQALLEAWFNGRVAKNSQTFAFLRSAWPAPFRIVTVTGRIMSATEALEETYAAHGAYSDLRIKVLNPDARVEESGSHCIVVFEEQHSFSSSANTRLCTAFLKAPATESHSWIWLHVHESPLRPEGAA